MGTFISLTSYKNPLLKEQQFFNRENYYVSNENEFKNIPNSIYAYEVSERTAECFEFDPLGKHFVTREGMATAGNDVFLRLWFEVAFGRITFDCTSEEESVEKKVKWVPYNKGGGTRFWYGNNDYVVDWSDNGLAIRNNKDPKTGRIRSHNYNGIYGFKEGLTWSAISSGNISVRYCEAGFLFDSKGAKGFPIKKEDMFWILGLLNSKVSMQFLKFISPTLDFKVGDVICIPFNCVDGSKQEISEISNKLVESSKQDWDMFETSWGFERHPLIGTGLLSDLYSIYENDLEQRFANHKALHEELNRLLIADYGFAGELSPELEDSDIDIRKADLHRDVVSLISYAVGCIMGRYSLKENALIYAGGTWDTSHYSDEFKPCEYGILPITEEQFFDEDLCTRVVDFIKIVYGDTFLNENLKFIATALKPDSYDAPKKILREYLFNDFFGDHYQVYQHRPIYWQLDSGKAGGFRAIAYMHRFNENTLPLVRTEFIQDLRYKYEEEMQRQKNRLEGASTTAETNAVKKEIAALDKKIVECAAYDELLNHATSSIQKYLFDLDDGVKTNYAKFLSIDGDNSSNILTVIKL